MLVFFCFSKGYFLGLLEQDPLEESKVGPAFLEDLGSSVEHRRLQCVLAPLLPLPLTSGCTGAASKLSAPSFASLLLPFVVVVGLVC